MDKVLLAFFTSLITVLVITPLIIKLALKLGITDKPNYRKVHAKVMPRMGGLAIFIGVAAGYFVSDLHNEKITAITAGAILVVILGILDDKFELSAKIKFTAQILIAVMIVSTGLTIDFITIPFVVEKFQLGWMAYPITILWIVGITNAINLIDGLDGLAAGISSIGIATIAVMAGLAGKDLILLISVIILGSTIGFLFYNFHPAKIFMGDTGALFLGYSISILSLLGLYKSVTLFSIIIPILIMGVPIFDTTFAIIRRIYNKQPISSPDKSHLHHRILAMGLSHRNTVLAIYGLGVLFSISAILLSSVELWGALLIMFSLFVITLVIVEAVGLVNDQYRPFIKFYRKVSGKQQ
ncbi:glycosyltransferase family 4 protein [Rossellomorea vietnamensis]|uniref:Undecaprenyl/decaprenyl-phosphate alpha-N-acetylglucosaminyl 1-phosphate transferase n=1 Tax=Rossellomorea aquimaris TaxID=189382 RepID=A0A5D4TLY5_9BACI|nr:MraY family glycosyltransferase [Rossellomorea aquimaris]TYS75831.1 undecaprenyl/decaprenyl-phosphate alpha-N-acetylglucosaminyl 1-phosphate transferase [Rossellomorea aquimaris]